MNILVTGANGQLGNEMRIISKNSTDTYIFTDVNQVEGLETTYLDITDLESIRKMIAEYKVEAIVNCAAYTNVDTAESNEKIAEKLNAEAPQNLAVAIKEVNGLLIHISTDYVFGGDPYNIPCKEDQKGTPTGVYGQTKLHGEQGIIATNCSYVILRTAWLYSEYGKNFVKTMLVLTATKLQLKVVFDQVGTPTYALDLARAIVAILDDYHQECTTYNHQWAPYSKRGIYHYSNEGVTSWYDFTKVIQQIAAELMDCSSLTANRSPLTCEVLPCHSNEFPSPVKRPAYSVLDKTKVKQTFGIQIPYWTDSLRLCMSNIMKE